MNRAGTCQEHRLAMITEALSCVGPDKLRRQDGAAVEWIVADAQVDYPSALERMGARAAAIARNEASEAVWLVEHPPLYTAGTSADGRDLLQPGRFPVYEAGRGGEYTYHGPGQRVAYLMLDLRRLDLGVRDLVTAMEQSLVDLLAGYGIEAAPKADAPGVYVAGDKIASLGLRVSRGCSFHGLALNVDMDMTPFLRINPCGYAGLKTVDLATLRVNTDWDRVARRLGDELAAYLAP